MANFSKQIEELEHGLEKRPEGKFAGFPAWLPLGGIYVVFMLGNVLLPTVFWQPGNATGRQNAAFFCGGILASQVGLLGAWTALGPQPWTHRLLVTLFMLGSVATCLLAGMSLAARAGVFPLEIHLLIYGLSLAGWLVALSCLAAMRCLFGWRIDRVNRPCEHAEGSRVSIAYLLTAISLIAVLIAMIKAVLPSKARAPIDLWETALICSIFVLYMLLLFLPSLWLAMKAPTPYWVLLPLLLVLVVLGPLAMAGVDSVRATVWDKKAVLHFYLVSFGFVSAVCVPCAVLRLGGFELRRDNRFEFSEAGPGTGT